MMKLIFDVLSKEPHAYPAAVVATAVLLVFMTKGVAGYVQQVFLSRAGNRVVANIQRKTNSIASVEVTRSTHFYGIPRPSYSGD